MWILCLAEDSLEISSLIFSEKQLKNIYECRLIGALRVNDLYYIYPFILSLTFTNTM